MKLRRRPMGLVILVSTENVSIPNSLCSDRIPLSQKTVFPSPALMIRERPPLNFALPEFGFEVIARSTTRDLIRL
jgi:hypothetical protein